MQRRDFILTSILALPAFASTDRFKRFIIADSKAFVLHKGQSRFGVPTPFKGVNPNDLKVSGKDTGGELSIFEYNGRSKGGPPMHIHHHQDEVFYISSGQYRFQCGEDIFDLLAGDIIFLPRAIPHAWAQMSDEGQLLFFFQPAGKMEEFFRKIGDGSQQPEGYDPFAEHEMQVVGPPFLFNKCDAFE